MITTHSQLGIRRILPPIHSLHERPVFFAGASLSAHDASALAEPEDIVLLEVPRQRPEGSLGGVDVVGAGNSFLHRIVLPDEFYHEGEGVRRVSVVPVLWYAHGGIALVFETGRIGRVFDLCPANEMAQVRGGVKRFAERAGNIHSE